MNLRNSPEVSQLGPSGRRPNKENSLASLRKHGLHAQTILDVGVKYETAELRHAFADLKHLLFEPPEEYFDDIRANYEGLDYELVPRALSDKEGEDLLTIPKWGRTPSPIAA